MACTRTEHVIQPAALENNKLKILSVSDKKASKKYRTHLYGFDFGEVAKKQ